MTAYTEAGQALAHGLAASSGLSIADTERARWCELLVLMCGAHAEGRGNPAFLVCDAVSYVDYVLGRNQTGAAFRIWALLASVTPDLRYQEFIWRRAYKRAAGLMADRTIWRAVRDLARRIEAGQGITIAEFCAWLDAQTARTVWQRERAARVAALLALPVEWPAHQRTSAPVHKRRNATNRRNLAAVA